MTPLLVTPPGVCDLERIVARSTTTDSLTISAGCIVMPITMMARWAPLISTPITDDSISNASEIAAKTYASRLITT